MFTGIIEELGEIKEVKRGQLSISSNIAKEGLKIGDSISVNGVCLTVTQITNNFVKVDVVPQTLMETTLGLLRIGERVNLERSLKIEERISGHFVTGHIDGIGIIKKKIQRENSIEIEIGLPQKLLKYIIQKGSIAVDGVSLTIACLLRDGIGIAIIPHTAKITTLGIKRVGDRVNIEVDQFSKYIEKQIEGRA